MKSFCCTQPVYLKDFTDCVYPQASFVFSRLLSRGDVKVNGVRQRGNIPLKSGDSVQYYLTKKEAEAQTHRVIFEDENILVADKFSGVSVEGLTSELNETASHFPAHRLDRNTSGVIVFAKNEGALNELKAAFSSGNADKRYLAICKNNFKSPSGELSAYLKKDAKRAEVKIFPHPAAGAVKISTGYKVEEVRGDLALVTVFLHTGKTHQIRAHFAFLGCPVLGDGKYGDRELNSKYSRARQCLLAKSLTFNSFTASLAYLNGREFKSSQNLTFPQN